MGKQVEKKRKKKGRPSLLDLQKRSIRLQKQQEEEQQQQGRRSSSSNPSPNPYLRFPASGTQGRRVARRDPTEGEGGGEDGEDEEEGSGKRREKKLKLVLRLHQGEDGGGSSGNPLRGRGGGDSSGSESKDEGGTPRKKRKIDTVAGDGSGRDKTERHNSASKATEGEPSDSGPTTPLPDKKLLEFILDRLQKKDTYGVFAEPVDPEELPDYHEIIDHPMDFSTVRKRLSSGYYKHLEMFEKDVFLICSNAMSYNAPDTIYFRQARSIQELAKKNFENLRQDSDEEEPEPKVVRRGRPPGKNTTKKAVGRIPSDRATSDFTSNATLANAGDTMFWSNSSHDLSRKGFASDKLGSTDALARSNHRLNSSETSLWMAEKLDRNDDSGYVRGTPLKSGKKAIVFDENRRNTYKQPQSSTSWPESSILTTFDGEKRQLVPVGLHTEHAYARSLARFAANLGPVGWEIAAKQIEQVLPPGTKFGRGWVGEPDVPQQYQPPLLSTSPPHPSPHIRMPNSSVSSKGDATPTPEQPNPRPNNGTVEENRISKPTPAASSTALFSIRPSISAESAEPARGLERDGGFGPVSASSIAGVCGMRPRPSFQLNQNMAIHPGMNGVKAPFGFEMQQASKMVCPTRPMGSFVQEVPMTHARALDMVSRGNNSFSHTANSPQLDPERPMPSNPGMARPQDHPRGVWRALSLNPKPESAPPPDLNIRFQSPGSPPSGVAVDSQQPDLALQL